MTYNNEFCRHIVGRIKIYLTNNQAIKKRYLNHK